MRRVRQQASRGRSTAAAGRLAFAVACSATLHVLLISGLALRPGTASGPHQGVIHAHLMPADPMTPRIRAPRVPVSTPLPPAFDATASLPLATAAPVAEEAALAVAEPLNAETRNTGTSDPASQVSVVEAPDPVHYPAKDLDLYPQLLGPMAPVYPESARAARIGGAVTLLVLIDEMGKVTDVSVVDAAPEGVFDDSARQAFFQAAFAPAQKSGRAVRSRILVSVDYDPDKD